MKIEIKPSKINKFFEKCLKNNPREELGKSQTLEIKEGAKWKGELVSEAYSIRFIDKMKHFKMIGINEYLITEEGMEFNQFTTQPYPKGWE